MNKHFTLFVVCIALSFTGTAQQHDTQGEIRLPAESLVYPINGYVSAHTFAKTATAARDFAAQHPDWRFHVISSTGATPPHRAWGKGIQINGYTTVDNDNAEAAGLQFIDEYRDLLQADPASLKLQYAAKANNTFYVRYLQQYQGLDVLFSGVDLRITPRGNVVLFGSDYQPNINVQVHPGIPVDEAKTAAQSGLDPLPGNGAVLGGELYILPVRSSNATTYHLVYRFTVVCGWNKRFDTFVDAHTGTVLWRKNTIHSLMKNDETILSAASTTATIQVMTMVHNPDHLQPEVEVPCPYVQITFNGNTFTTDANGICTIDFGAGAAGAAEIHLDGIYANTNRMDNLMPDAEAKIQIFIVPGGSYRAVFSDSNSVRAERNSYYHVTRVSRWVRGIDTSKYLSKVDDPMLVFVNIREVDCNAFWDGTAIVTMEESQSCRNTGAMPSVLYHEYGHAIDEFLYTALTGDNITNRAIEEANADIVSAFILDDPKIGTGFFKDDDSRFLRTCDNDLRYPEDRTGESHDDGMILSGAIWDVRKSLGMETTSRLAHFAKYGVANDQNLGIAMTEFFLDFLLADDDDADLSNGTPHSSVIIPAFARHGIPACGMKITHPEILESQPANSPLAINGMAFIDRDDSQQYFYPAQIILHYSIDNWATESSVNLPYDRNTTEFRGEVPGQPEGAVMRYYFEAVNNYGTSTIHPLHPHEASYIALFGYTSIYSNTMEKNDYWTVSGNASNGLWERVVPVGTYVAWIGEPPAVDWVQPNEDHTPGTTGRRCWVTGNTPRDMEPYQALAYNDVNDGSTILTTTAYDISTCENPTLRFFRWFSNDAMFRVSEDSWNVQVSGDGGTSWVDIELTKQPIAAWIPRVFPLNDYIPHSNSVMIRFLAEDIQSNTIVEAAVDDFQILDHHGITAVNKPAPVSELALSQNYPNPASGITTFTYSLPEQEQAVLKVYDLLGNESAVIASRECGQGSHLVALDAGRLADGMYICKLITPRGIVSRTFIVRK